MNSPSRHRVVHSLSLSVLQQQVTELLREGWTTIGSPALAQPVDRSCPACWVQALYLHSKQELENLPAPPSHPGSIKDPASRN
jgi:hypothetical protein